MLIKFACRVFRLFREIRRGLFQRRGQKVKTIRKNQKVGREEKGFGREKGGVCREPVQEGIGAGSKAEPGS
jgi:hypothetical protein